MADPRPAAQVLTADTDAARAAALDGAKDAALTAAETANVAADAADAAASAATAARDAIPTTLAPYIAAAEGYASDAQDSASEAEGFASASEGFASDASNARDQAFIARDQAEDAAGVADGAASLANDKASAAALSAADAEAAKLAVEAGFDLVPTQAVGDLVPVFVTEDDRVPPIYVRASTGELSAMLDEPSRAAAVAAVADVSDIVPANGLLPLFVTEDNRVPPISVDATGRMDLIPTPRTLVRFAPPVPQARGRLALADRDASVVVLGDSIFARQQYTPATDPDTGAALALTALPPGVASASQMWAIYKALPAYAIPVYARADAVVTSETGAWTTAVSGVAGWDDVSDREGWTRYSDSANASVAFTFGAAYDRLNVVYRTSTTGTLGAAIACASGQVEAWNGAAWVEASGYAFSMREVDEGAQHGTTKWGQRVRLRRASGGSGDVAITVSNVAGAGRFMWWGVEQQVPGRTLPRLHLAARGGHRLTGGAVTTEGYRLMDYVYEDVIERSPDLVILELPLINIVAGTVVMSEALGEVQDFLWGDRPGYENAWALAQTLPAAEVVIVIPNYARNRFNTDGSFKDLGGGMTAERLYDAAAAYCAARGLRVLDVRPGFRAAAVVSYGGNLYTALGGGNLTADETHPNAAGAALYRTVLSTVFTF